VADIELIDVEKRFGAVHVIRKLNLTIQHGEFVVLLGPSGCGKTTTLRAIAGLEDIDAGSIRIGGVPVENLPASERDIAFVFQLYALYPHLSAYQNIAFPLHAANLGRAVIDAKVRQVAQILRLEALLDKKPAALSGGDMQRVAIGRALVRQPKAILMDEPIGSLDAKLREEMRTELKRLHIENGATTVYVTHDQIEAMAMADRIAIMHDGVLQQVGTPHEVYSQPANLFVAQFVGSPIMNVVRCAVSVANGRMLARWDGMDGAFAFDAQRHDAIVAAGADTNAVALGVRPEAVVLDVVAGAGAVQAEAHLIEPVGAFDIVDVKVGAEILRARTAPGRVARPGSPVWIKLDAQRTHFFDQRNGGVLRGAGNT
jgi:multiple sugar transport system ATP-binding protein